MITRRRTATILTTGAVGALTVVGVALSTAGPAAAAESDNAAVYRDTL